MSDKPIYFMPTIGQITSGLDAISQQFNLLMALAVELGVDDEMEALMLEIPRCREAVIQHYNELQSMPSTDNPKEL